MRDRNPKGSQALCVMLGVLALAGCGDRPKSVAPSAKVQLAEAPAEDAPASRQALVREHTLELEVASDAIGQMVDRLVRACGERPAGECLLLATQVTGGDYPGGEVQLRLVPTAVPPILSLAGSLGRVVGQSSTASDVTEQLADSAARLKTLELYRAQLEKLQATARDVDSLIKIAGELARTQTEIDALGSERAATLARTQTERLTVTLRGPTTGTGARAVSQAIDGFGANVLAAVAMIITVLSGLIPIAVVIAVGWLLWRAWRRRSRRA